jgi:hypothetical protein
MLQQALLQQPALPMSTLQKGPMLHRTLLPAWLDFELKF